MDRLTAIARAQGRTSVSGAPEGYDAYVAAEAAKRSWRSRRLRRADDARAAIALESARFFAPDLAVLHFPAWDCLPYDRVRRAPISKARALPHWRRWRRAAKGRSGARCHHDERAGSREPLRKMSSPKRVSSRAAGTDVDREALTRFLARNTYRAPARCASRRIRAARWHCRSVAAGESEPLRLDFFGDESGDDPPLRCGIQLSTGTEDRVTLLPASEAPLDPESISRFRTGYVAAFGAVTDGDPLYEGSQRRAQACRQEHWLPLFHEPLDTLFDYVGRAQVFLSRMSMRRAKRGPS
jgi:transcription-repair coupling factor (superfamily II helicase)